MRLRTQSALAVVFMILGSCTAGGPDVPLATSSTIGGRSLDTAPGSVEPAEPLPTRPAAAWTAPTDGCPEPGPVQENAGRVVRIGTVNPVSGGVAAASSAPIAAGMQLYIDYANRSGLIEGVRLELLVEDDGFDPSLTADAVQALADQGAMLIAGAVRPPNERASVALANSLCLPMINDLGDPDALGNPEQLPWVTSMRVPYEVEGTLIGRHAAALAPGLDAALVLNDDNFGAAFGLGFTAGLTEAGGRALPPEVVPSGDLAAGDEALDRIAAEKPDVIFLAVSTIQCVGALRKITVWKQLVPSWQPAIYIASPCAHRAVMSGLAGESAEGVYSATSYTDAGDSSLATLGPNAQFLAAYEQSELTGDVQTTALGWSVAEATVQVLLAASPFGLNRTSIMEAARTMDITLSLTRDGVSYRTSGTTDPYPIESMQIVQWHRPRFGDAGPLVTEFEH